MKDVPWLRKEAAIMIANQRPQRGRYAALTRTINRPAIVARHHPGERPSQSFRACVACDRTSLREPTQLPTDLADRLEHGPFRRIARQFRCPTRPLCCRAVPARRNAAEGDVRVCLPFGALQVKDKRIILPGATKDSLKSLPEFKYATTN
jgi:hypothetical protein